jgi:hypothetical protein
MAAGIASAQTPPPATPPPAPPATSSAANPAIATPGTNATTPAKGANSFSMSQARSRIEDSGFTDVTGLAKDPDGIWRGQANKSGASTPVWLDYKGNVGTN